MDDHQINELLSQHDQEALYALMTQYHNYAYLFASRLLDSAEDAEECVSDALMNVWDYAATHRVDNLRALIASCVRRRATDRLRQKTAARRPPGVIALDELGEAIDPRLVDEEVEAGELREAIADFVRHLPRLDRQIFILRYFYGYSAAEIAKQVERSQSCVSSKLFRCRQKLRGRLQQFI